MKAHTTHQRHTSPWPCALTIAGSDSGGGAGIQGDLKTFAALGVYGASVITAVTAQNTIGVRGVDGVSPAMVAAQLDAVLEDLPIRAVKIGMLFSPDIVMVVAERLRAYPSVPVVLDPVLAATSGPALLDDEAWRVMVGTLFPLATLVTPNLPEAARLRQGATGDDPIEIATALLALGSTAVLLKGGHAGGDILEDVLVSRDAEPRVFRHPRIATPHTHGTGCSLSAAIAAGLAHDLPLPRAVASAVDWLQGAIAHAWPLGAGHGPIHHGWQRRGGGRTQAE